MRLTSKACAVRVLMVVGLAAAPACSTDVACTQIGTTSGVTVDAEALPAGVAGTVCLLAGACLQVPSENPPFVLDMPEEPSAVEVEVRLSDRPAERLSVPLQPVYANGEACGVSGYQGTVRLSGGPAQVA